MKVICIDAGIRGDGKSTGTRFLVEGNVYTLVREGVGKNKFGVFTEGYELEGQPVPGIYAKDRFAHVSDIDETTFERNYNKEPVHAH